MAIDRKRLSVVTVGELLTQDLRIPNYQRPYSWEPKHALQLLDDVREAMRSTTASEYALGSIVLYRDQTTTHFDVVDGQQRLQTLYMLQTLLGGDEIFLEDPDPRAPITTVYARLRSRVNRLDIGERDRAADYLASHCVIVRVETNDKDEAFRFFDSAELPWETAEAA